MLWRILAVSLDSWSSDPPPVGPGGDDGRQPVHSHEMGARRIESAGDRRLTSKLRSPLSSGGRGSLQNRKVLNSSARVSFWVLSDLVAVSAGF